MKTRVVVGALVAAVVFGAAAEMRAADAKAEAAFQSFDAWLHRYQARGAARGLAAAGEMSTAAAEGAPLARERRNALRQLARTDPRQALARAMRPSVLKSLPPAVQQESESYADVCGSEFGFEIGDNFPSEDAPPVSVVKRTLTIGGRTYEAQVFGRRLGTTAKAIHANGVVIGDVVVLNESPLRRMDPEEAAEDPTVRLQCGLPSDTCIAAKVGAQTLIFGSEAALLKHQAALEKDEATLGLQHGAGRKEALAPVAPQATDDGPTLASAWTMGNKRLLYIRVDMSDRPGDPVAAATVQSTMDGPVNQYYISSSYNQTSIATTVVPTVRLPRTYAEYETVGDGQLMTDAIAASKAAGHDPATYDLYIVAFPGFSSFGYSGKASVGRARVWLNGSFGSGVTAHELGHNYGVHHANWWQTTDNSVIGAGANVEYGNPFDVMGRSGITGQFNAWFKTRFDWILPSGYTTVTTSGTYRIGAIDEPTETGQRALKIVKNTTKNYWVEWRKAFTSNRWTSNGVLLNWGYNTNTGSHLLDTTPGTTGNQNDSALLVGRTFSDLENNIHITPLARTATTMDVAVKLGVFPGNAPPTAAAAANPTTVARNQPVTLTATATDPNGDTLAYFWEFDDNTYAPSAASVTKSWATSGTKVVRLVVTDMVGGTATAETTVIVDTASATPTPRPTATPTRTPTPVPTPTPTAPGTTPTPTSTPQPTATPTATRTPTPRPTATPAPTSTPTATPTATPFVPTELRVNGSTGPITVAPGAVVTVSVSGGPGNTRDWVAKYGATAADSQYYADYQYLNGTKTPPASGLSSATLTFTMPTVPGAYNFRFLVNNSFTVLAKSPIVTVGSDTVPTPTPAPTSTPVPTSTPAPTATPVPGATATPVSTATPVPTATSAPTATPVPAATATPTPSGPGAALRVNGSAAPIVVAPGAVVTVTVSGGPGNPTDWVAKYNAGAPDAQYYPDYLYLNGVKTPPTVGLSSGTLSFTMPTVAGVYNFRFFLKNTFTLIAISPNVTVSTGGGATPAPTPAATATPTPGPTATPIPGATATPTPGPTATPGPGATIRVNGSAAPITVARGTIVTVAISGGSGNAKDWVAKYVAGTPNEQYLPDYVYLSGTKTPPAVGVSSATVSFTMPTAGTFDFRLLHNNTFAVLGTSPTVTVTP